MRTKGNWRKRKAQNDADPTQGTNGKYVLTCSVQEEAACNLYCVALNTVSLQHADLFATVGGNRATLYRLEPGGGIHAMQCYVDANEDEEYFTCAWCKARDGSSGALLAVAGLSGVVRVIDASREVIFRNLRGGGAARGRGTRPFSSTFRVRFVRSPGAFPFPRSPSRRLNGRVASPHNPDASSGKRARLGPFDSATAAR